MIRPTFLHSCSGPTLLHPVTSFGALPFPCVPWFCASVDPVRVGGHAHTSTRAHTDDRSVEKSLMWRARGPRSVDPTSPGCFAHAGPWQFLLSLWKCMFFFLLRSSAEQLLVQILVVMAHIQMRALRTEVERCFHVKST